MKSICIICKIEYNCEEVAECIKCKGSVCQECVNFEDCNYYCYECFTK